MKTLSKRDAEKALKVFTVLLRDHSRLSFADVMRALVYCWWHTESVAQAEAREAREARE
jgi:hypothetical protein